MAAIVSTMSSRAQGVCQKVHVGEDDRAVFDPGAELFIRGEDDGGAGSLQHARGAQAGPGKLMDDLQVLHHDDIPRIVGVAGGGGKSGLDDKIQILLRDGFAGVTPDAAAVFHSLHNDSCGFAGLRILIHFFLLCVFRFAAYRDVPRTYYTYQYTV